VVLLVDSFLGLGSLLSKELSFLGVELSFLGIGGRGTGVTLPYLRMPVSFLK
jgi:hypothetical protein